ncbi:MAG: CPBP family intramembrane glutamic endopeptidase [Candidatus Borkfalkiaceae bacterium]|nr:CPBP family intramembrane glutamic endopeptidase [Christensenellaceae bacterium]
MKNKDGFISEKLISDAEKSPFFHIAIVALLAIGLSSIPLESVIGGLFKNEGDSYLFCGAIIRLLLTVAAIVLSLKYGFYKPFVGSAKPCAYLLLLPALLVILNNFPIIGFFGSGEKMNSDGFRIALYFIYCFSVAAFEETVFRGIVFPLTYIALKNRKVKKTLFWSAAFSSAVFGAAHIFNLFAGAGIGSVILQIGYSFLIGGLCAVSLVVCKNLYVPVVFHFIYDCGGFFFDEKIGVATGIRWDNITLIVTAVLGVIVTVYMAILAFTRKNEEAEVLFSYKAAAKKENAEESPDK